MLGNQFQSDHEVNHRGIPHSLRDVILLLGRILAGSILMAHGADKLFGKGISATAASFAKMGIPAPHLSAVYAIFAELGCGLALLVGLATPVACLFIVLNFVGAWWFAHRGNGVFIQNKGWELVALIGTIAAVFAAVGPGRYSVDALLRRRVTPSRHSERPQHAGVSVR